mgnify:CR=1 FL=1
MCTCYPIINRVSELKVHIELTRFVQPEKIEIDANERAVNEKSPYCFFVCTTFDSFLNDLPYRIMKRLIFAKRKKKLKSQLYLETHKQNLYREYPKCFDCKSMDTICCQFLITRFSRHTDRIHVILVNDTLGY